MRLFSIDRGEFTSQDSTRRAPLLTSHTIDGYSIESQQNHAGMRESLPCSQGIDGQQEYLTPRAPNASAHMRAPILLSHTIDGSICRYETPQTMMPISDYALPGVDQSNVQITGQSVITPYGVSHSSLICPR